MDEISENLINLMKFKFS